MRYRALIFFTVLLSWLSLGPPALAQQPSDGPAAEAGSQGPPPLPQDPLERGQTLLRSGDLEGAEAAFHQALAASPGLPEAEYLLGVIHLQRQEAEQALARFDRVLKSLPDHLLSHFNRGRAFLLLGNRQAAQEAFERAVEIEPSFFPAYLELGLIHEAVGRVEAAVAAYQRVIRIGGDAPQAAEAVARARERLARMGDTPEKARRAAELFKQGQEHLADSLFEAAQADFEAILELVPQNGVARFFLAQILLQTGDIARATRLLEEAVKFDQSDWRPFFLLGQVYQAQGRWEEALLVLMAVDRVVPEGPIKEDLRDRLPTLREVVREQRLKESFREELGVARQWFDQGIRAMQEEKLDEAIDRFKRAIQLDPGNNFYFYNLGIAYFAKVDLINATKALQRAVQLKKDYGPAHFFLGQIYVASGDGALEAGDVVGASREFGAALVELRRTLDLGAEPWQHNRAREKAEELEELTGRLQEALGYGTAGEALGQQGKFEEALKHFQRAAELVAEDPFARINMGRIYAQTERPEKALEAYQAAVEASPKNATPYLFLGQHYEELERIEEAVEAYETAAEKGPLLVDPLIRLGTLYFNQKRYEEARSQYKKVLRMDAKQPEPYYYQGAMAEDEGRENEAREFYDTFLTLAPPEDSDSRRFVMQRLAALDRFSGSWSHTFLSYNSNANASGINPVSEIFSTFSLGLRYVAWRKKNIFNLLPYPLTVPVNFSSSTTTYLESSLLTNTNSVSATANTLFGNYDLSTSYSFRFSQTDERPSTLNHTFSAGLGRSQSYPTSAGLDVSFSILSSLLNSANDRTTLSFNPFVQQSLRSYGSLSLQYSYSQDDSTRIDQSGSSHFFSLGYSSPPFGKISLNMGFNTTLTEFDIPRVIRASAAESDFSLERTLEKTTNMAFSLGATYRLPQGVLFTVSYQHVENTSNLDIPRPSVPLTQQELEQIRPTDNFTREVLSLRVSKSF